MLDNLNFRPLPCLASPHVQTILGSFTRPGLPPPSTQLLVHLADGDALFCQVSTPSSWENTQKTIVMVHGLGGSDSSNYMIRIGRKLYDAGHQVVRVNLRACGPGQNLARLPYHGGISDDILAVLKVLKEQTPLSPLILLGFSLGGNIALKLSGEMGKNNLSMLQSTIAVCAPIDLAETVSLISTRRNSVYHRYYMNHLMNQSQRWTNGRKITSLYEFDDLVTATSWGFAGAADYYRKSSSRFYLSDIKHPCYLLFSADDPFVNYRHVLETPLPEFVKVGLCQNGGHMGFLGWTERAYHYFWLDNHLLTHLTQTDATLGK